MLRDLGDFQTPPALVKAVLHRLQTSGKTWTRVLEPTCGLGNFIKGLLALDKPPLEICGIELQSLYVEQAHDLLSKAKVSQVTITQGNLFDLDLKRLHWTTSGHLLVVGNPPWVTNSELSTLQSSNLPKKTNLKNFTGFDAMTGSSNFDITEYIWLKLIRELSHEQATIALLCKTSVARNVLQFAAKAKLPIGNAALIKVDAQKWFGVAVDACLFCLDLNPAEHQYDAEVFDSLESTVPTSTMGFIGGQLVSNIQRNKSLNIVDGTSPLMWRQGLKHDAASIVELTIDNSGSFYNKLGQVVEVESDYIYPFLKSSDLAGKGKLKPKRAVIVPQKYFGEDTALLLSKAPLLRAYLTKHLTAFEARKSSIYNNQPLFAYFGLGEYSFAQFKVAISGMYKTPVFKAIAPVDGRAVMLDDTCYFLPCSSWDQAVIIETLLNSNLCLEFLNSIVFWDAKRPVTKKLLQRIDLYALLKQENRTTFLDVVTKKMLQLQNNLDLNEIRRQIAELQSANLTDLERLISGQNKSDLLPLNPNLQLALPGFDVVH